jgi:hypothetical protein
MEVLENCYQKVLSVQTVSENSHIFFSNEKSANISSVNQAIASNNSTNPALHQFDTTKE